MLLKRRAFMRMLTAAGVAGGFGMAHAQQTAPPRTKLDTHNYPHAQVPYAGNDQKKGRPSPPEWTGFL